MPRRIPAAALAAVLLVLPAAASAACATASTGARCVAVVPSPAAPARAGEDTLSSASAATPAVAIGDRLVRGEHSILLNASYYGLPPVSDGWVYMRIGHDLYRVDWASQQVLERVTDRAAANF